MKTLMPFLAFLLLAGCYNTFTREDLGGLKDEVIVIWTVDGSHYHLQQWTIDDQGNVNGVGTMCVSKSTKFDHPYENAKDFSGTIRKHDITTVKTSSTHQSTVMAILLAVGVIAGAIAIKASFGGF